MAAASINALSPQEAWKIADNVYLAQDSTSSKQVGDNFSLLGLRDFEFQDLLIQGVSGPMPASSRTGFALIAKGITSKRPGEALFATRGTASLADVWTDLNGAFTRSNTGHWIHSGFNDTYNSIRGMLNGWLELNRDVHTVHCVGHSLGGALATLASEELTARGKQVALYTFGSPRVGIQSFGEYMRSKLQANMYRVANVSDAVTMVGPWLYSHIPAATIYPVSWGGWSVSLNAHKMASYKTGIGDAEWNALGKAPDLRADEDEVKGLLSSSDTADRIAMFSMPGLYIINKCLTWLVRKAARYAPVAVMAGMTVLDKLAYLVYTGYAASAGDDESYKRLLGWIMQFLGHPIATVGDITVAFIRWCLGTFLSVLNSLAWRAVQLVHSTVRH